MLTHTYVPLVNMASVMRVEWRSGPSTCSMSATRSTCEGLMRMQPSSSLGAKVMSQMWRMAASARRRLHSSYRTGTIRNRTQHRYVISVLNAANYMQECVIMDPLPVCRTDCIQWINLYAPRVLNSAKLPNCYRACPIHCPPAVVCTYLLGEADSFQGVPHLLELSAVQLCHGPVQRGSRTCQAPMYQWIQHIVIT